MSQTCHSVVHHIACNTRLYVVHYSLSGAQVWPYMNPRCTSIFFFFGGGGGGVPCKCHLEQSEIACCQDAMKYISNIKSITAPSISSVIYTLYSRNKY